MIGNNLCFPPIRAYICSLRTTCWVSIPSFDVVLCFFTAVDVFVMMERYVVSTPCGLDLCFMRTTCWVSCPRLMSFFAF